MRIKTATIENMENIEAPVTGGGTKGLPYDTIEGWTGVDHLDKLDAGNCVVLRRDTSGTLNLETRPLP
jgi:hypothetical protein